MELSFSKELVAQLKDNKLLHPLIAISAKRDRYHDEFSVSAFAFSPVYLEKLRAFLSKDSTAHSKMLQKLSQFNKVCANLDGFVARRLDSLEAALKALVMSSGKDRLLWHEETGLPWLVDNIRYEPADRDSPAIVRLHMVANSCGSQTSRTLTWGAGDLKEEADNPVLMLLLREGFIRETPELVEAYKTRMDRWKIVYDAHYKQFLYRSSDSMLEAYDDDDSWRFSTRSKKRVISAGVFKVVNDVPVFKHSGRNNCREFCSVKSMPRVIDEAEELEEEFIEDTTTNFAVPIHPYVYVFNLETHRHQWVLSDVLTEYVYNKQLINKLVLPDEHKVLVDILTSNRDILSADIVAGKSAGTIVLATGEPGLGKSLTAEAYAEKKEMILYKVQSDQLGTSASNLEGNLKKVFQCAERWDAVLLIDECDIYVHERGMDIEQNAIVGTLLRTFEYFNGVMFLTTNRDMIVDDAILSRCSAVIRYDYPTKEHAVLLYQMFADLFEMALKDSIVDEFYKRFPRLSGRSIKNILRLTARRGILSPTLDDILLSKSYVPHESHTLARENTSKVKAQ